MKLFMHDSFSLQEHPTHLTSPWSPLVTDAPFWHLHWMPQSLHDGGPWKGGEEEVSRESLPLPLKVPQNNTAVHNFITHLWVKHLFTTNLHTLALHRTPGMREIWMMDTELTHSLFLSNNYDILYRVSSSAWLLSPSVLPCGSLDIIDFHLHQTGTTVLTIPCFRHCAGTGHKWSTRSTCHHGGNTA